MYSGAGGWAGLTASPLSAAPLSAGPLSAAPLSAGPLSGGISKFFFVVRHFSIVENVMKYNVKLITTYPRSITCFHIIPIIEVETGDGNYI